LKNAQEAEDIAQAALLRIQKLEHNHSVQNPKAFLFQVASNLAIDSLRRQKLHGKYVQMELARMDLDSESVSGSDISPERILEAQQQLHIIYQAIDRLPAKCRQAFILHRNQGLSYSAIAEQMGVSVSSVEKYIFQALKQCRQALQEEPCI
jgi:RNA polymerase sigma-70 factor (ECF subfamily)